MKQKVELGEPGSCRARPQATSCAGSTWGQHNSLHCKTIKRNYSIPLSWDPSPNSRNVHRDWYMQAVRRGIVMYCLGSWRAEGTGFGQCLSRRMLGLPRASVVLVLCSLADEVYPELTNSSWRKKETKEKGSKLVMQLLTWECSHQKWKSSIGRVKIPQKNHQVSPTVKHKILKGRGL